MVQLRLRYPEAEAQLTRFRTWFENNMLFAERSVISELKKYDHLCLLMGFLGSSKRPDLFKREFAIAGVFQADYVAASSVTREFTFVEFEGAENNSIFGPKSTNQMRDWGKQIQRGYSQIADWTWAKNDVQKDVLFQNAVGYPRIRETYVLVCGRDSTLDDAERARLEWRNDKTSIANADVLFMTYDDLILHFEGMIEVFKDAKTDHH